MFAVLATMLPAAATIPPPAPPPVATFDVGSLHVQQYGSGPKSLIFIPGLTCGPWVWAGDIVHFTPQYTVYALTLPGFDGQKSIAAPLFPTVSADFWKLLAQKGIVKPVIIGHSLGGTLGWLLATQHPELLGGVIAVEGLPVFPGVATLTPTQREAAANRAAVAMSSATPAQFETVLKQSALPGEITSPADVAAVAPLAGKSDPVASGEWLKEDLNLDLRPDLAKATIPILLISPYDVSVDGQYGAKSPADKAGFYALLIKSAPNAKVVSIPNSRHFVMYDQPQALTDAIAQFVAALP